MSNTRTVNPKVSILILGYNAKDHFQECLNSIFSQTFRDFEVIWMDSASTDDSLQAIKTTFSEVRILEIGFNAGYRRASNIGAREAQGEYLVIANQDTRMSKRWLEYMVSSIESDHAIAIVAPKILMFDDSSTMNEAGNTLHYTGLFGSRGLGAPAIDYCTYEPIAAMSGCCFLIRRDIWVALGGFSEDFDQFDTGWHASAEDIDLAWRTQLAGFKVVFCPNAIMHHKYSSKGMIPPRFGSYEWGRYLAVFRNYELTTLFLLFPMLVALEAGAWFYAIWKGRPWLIAKARAMYWIVTNIRQICRMRQDVQITRRIRDAVILSRMASTISVTHVGSSSRVMLSIQQILDSIFKCYHRFLMVGLKLVGSHE
jgi:GT2 family glycosyltransferase